jgi:hypothetical protein
MLRRLVLFGGLSLTAAASFGLAKLVHLKPRQGLELEVMPQRWLELERRELPDFRWASRPLGPGLAEVVRAQADDTRPEADLFDEASKHVETPAAWFLAPGKLSGQPMVGAGELIDGHDPAAVQKLLRKVGRLAVGRNAPMDGVWAMTNGRWEQVPLEHVLQQAVDDTIYFQEGQDLHGRTPVDRAYDGDFSEIALTDDKAQLIPPADFVAFNKGGKQVARAAWADVMAKAPGVLVREPGTVLEWYGLARFPTDDECAALGR